MKFEVRQFHLVLSQGGSTVFEETFERSNLGPSQTFEITDLKPGVYNLRLRYLSSINTLLGEYTQEIRVVAGQTAVVTNPNYQNVVLDFKTPRAIDSGLLFQGFAATDLNGDNIRDLILADEGEVGSVLLGRADGTFEPTTTFATGQGVESLEFADIDGDGLLDLWLCNRVSGTVAIYVANGDGTFQDPSYVSIASPRDLVLADLDGDKLIDFVVNSFSRPVVFLRNGTVQAIDQLPSTVAITVTDMNGDKIPDLITGFDDPVNDKSGLYIALSHGDGNFEPPLELAIGGRQPLWVRAIDVNGDRIPDLASANSLGRNLSIVISNGDGTFQPAVNYAVDNMPIFATTADFNEDGEFDFLVVNQAGNSVSLLLGNGDGTFQDAKNYPVGKAPFKAEVFDVNGDSRLDVVVACEKNVFLLLGKGDGTFEVEDTLAPPTDPNDVILLDLNGDNRLDLVSANAEVIIPVPESSNNVAVRLGNGDGTFREPATYPTGLGCTSVTSGDLNGDGILDLISSNVWDSSDLSVLLGRGDGTFQDAVRYKAGTGTEQVATGDVNGDGNLDLVAANPRNDVVSVLLGRGDGTFESAVALPVGSFPKSVAVGDLNKDGSLDLVSANSQGNNLSVLLGNGDGTFQSAQNYSAGSGATSVAVGDVDNDGNLDLVAANALDGNLSVLLGVGDGTFQAASNFLSGANPESVKVADMNKDGKLDLVSGNLQENTVGILLGNGDGTFQAAAKFSVGPGPNSIAVGDLNDDENLDLVCSNNNSIIGAYISVLMAR